MYSLLTFLNGAIIAIMILMNGRLNAQIGIWLEVAVVHTVGLIFAALFLLVTKKKIHLDKSQPWWIYIGGVIGVTTTVFQTFAYGKISMTSISALGLLGETLTSIIIDSFGLFGMEKHKLPLNNLIGLAFALAGILLMLDNSVGQAMTAVILALLVGLSIVTSRSINARLAKSVGSMQSSFINILGGFPVAWLLAFILTPHASINPAHILSGPFWIYLGGAVSIFTVGMNSYVSKHISQFSLTLLSFIGQLSMGFMIDIFSGTTANTGSLIGGGLISFGMILNMALNHIHASHQSSL